MAEHKLVPLDPELHHYLKGRALVLNTTLTELLAQVVAAWVERDKIMDQLKGDGKNG